MFKKILMFLFCCLLQFVEGAGTGGGAIVCNVRFGNTCFVRNGNLGIIIDAGGEDLSRESLNTIGALSVEIDKLLIIVTHTHDDHTNFVSGVVQKIYEMNPNKNLDQHSALYIGGGLQNINLNVREWYSVVDNPDEYFDEANPITVNTANEQIGQFVGDDRVKIAHSWTPDIGGICVEEHKDNIIVGIRFDKNDGSHEQLIFMGDACGNFIHNFETLSGIIRSVICQNRGISVIHFLAPHHGSNNNGECNWVMALDAIKNIPINLYISTRCGRYPGIPSAWYKFDGGDYRYKYYSYFPVKHCSQGQTNAKVTEYCGDLIMIDDLPAQPPQQPQALSARSASTKADEAAPCCNHNAGDNPLPAKAEGTTVQR